MADYALAISDVEIARYRLMADRAVANEHDWLKQAGVVPGATVADVGCGPAAMSVALAEIVGDAGRVIGVERDPASLEAAHQLVRSTGARNVIVQHGEATATGIEPGTVDVVIMRHVLSHNGGREQQIVDHLATLARPGGSVYVADSDLTAIRQVDADPGLHDQIDRYVEFQRNQGNDVQIGVHLAGLLRTAGLDLEGRWGGYNIVEFRPGMRTPAWAAREAMLAAGAVDDAVVARWEEAFARQDAAPGAAALYLPIFVALGRRPVS